MPYKSKQKALIIQNKFVGDVLASSVIAKNLLQIVEDCDVYFLCYHKALPILENNPYIKEIIYFEEKELAKPSRLLRLAQKIRTEKFDIIIDPYAKLQSQIIALFSGASNKISYQKTINKWIYNHTIPRIMTPEYLDCTAIENRLRLLIPLGKSVRDCDPKMEIFLTDQEINFGKNLMLEQGVNFSLPVKMLGVLGSGIWKTLPLNYMAEILSFLSNNYAANFLLNYIPTQQEEVSQLMEMVPEKSKFITTLLGNNIKEFLSILCHCDVLIGNEGGAINMAKGLNVPTFSIYSPHAYPREWGCYESSPQHESIHLEELKPELYHSVHNKDLQKDPLPYYLQYDTAYIQNKIVLFLNQIGIDQKK